MTCGGDSNHFKSALVRLLPNAAECNPKQYSMHHLMDNGCICHIRINRKSHVFHISNPRSFVDHQPHFRSSWLSTSTSQPSQPHRHRDLHHHLTWSHLESLQSRLPVSPSPLSMTCLKRICIFSFDEYCLDEAFGSKTLGMSSAPEAGARDGTGHSDSI